MHSFVLFHLKVILMKLVTSRLLPHERHHNTTEFDAEHFCGLSKFTLILSFAFIITFYLHQFLSNSLSFVFKSFASPLAISFLLSVIFCYSPHHRPFVDVFFRVFLPTSISRINIQLRFQRCCGWFSYQKDSEIKYNKVVKKIHLKQMKKQSVNS